MTELIETKVRATPEILSVILLDEVSTKLSMLLEKIGAIEKTQQDAVIRGHVFGYTVNATGNAKDLLQECGFTGNWHEVKIKNNGANDLYVARSERKYRAPVTVASGEEITLTATGNTEEFDECDEEPVNVYFWVDEASSPLSVRAIFIR